MVEFARAARREAAARPGKWSGAPRRPAARAVVRSANIDAGANASSPFLLTDATRRRNPPPAPALLEPAHVRFRLQAKAPGASRAGSDHAAVRILRRRLLLQGNRLGGRSGARRQRQDHPGGVRQCDPRPAGSDAAVAGRELRSGGVRQSRGAVRDARAADQPAAARRSGAPRPAPRLRRAGPSVHQRDSRVPG